MTRLRPSHALALLLSASPLTLVVAEGCATTAASRQAADLLIPVDQEVQLGQQMRPEILAKTPPVEDPAVQQYVQGIGQRLVQLAGDKIPKGITPKFTVLQSDQVNAFATPGGEIFVYSGLLRAVDNEAELASVLGHELGHVCERHVAQGLVSQLGVQTVASLALGQNPGMIQQLGAAVAANGYLLKNSRDMERQADHDGMGFMIKSQWDPHQMIAFFDKLAKEGGAGNSRVLSFLSNHPIPADRSQYLTAQLQQAGNKGGESNPQAIAAIQAKLPPPKATATAPGATPKG